MLQMSQKANEEMKRMQTHVDNLKRNLKQQSEQNRLKDTINNKIVMDIHNCVQFKDVKEWPSEMQRLYQVHVQGQEIK